MKKHQQRFWIIVGLTIACFLALMTCVIMGASETAIGIFGGQLTVLVPALLDSTAVEKRRKAPGKAAVADDVPFPGADTYQPAD